MGLALTAPCLALSLLLGFRGGDWGELIGYPVPERTCAGGELKPWSENDRVGEEVEEGPLEVTGPAAQKGCELGSIYQGLWGWFVMEMAPPALQHLLYGEPLLVLIRAVLVGLSCL